MLRKQLATVPQNDIWNRKKEKDDDSLYLSYWVPKHNIFKVNKFADDIITSDYSHTLSSK